MEARLKGSLFPERMEGVLAAAFENLVCYTREIYDRLEDFGTGITLRRRIDPHRLSTKTIAYEI